MEPKSAARSVHPAVEPRRQAHACRIGQLLRTGFALRRSAPLDAFGFSDARRQGWPAAATRIILGWFGHVHVSLYTRPDMPAPSGRGVGRQSACRRHRPASSTGPARRCRHGAFSCASLDWGGWSLMPLTTRRLGFANADCLRLWILRGLNGGLRFLVWPPDSTVCVDNSVLVVEHLDLQHVSLLLPHYREAPGTAVICRPLVLMYGI